MKTTIRRLIPVMLYAGLIVSICFTVWALLRTESYRQQTETIFSQCSEVQWRASQSRDKVARILGYLTLAARTGEINPRLLQDFRMLRFNLKALSQLDYAKEYVPPEDTHGLERSIELIDKVILPLTLEGGRYDELLKSVSLIDYYLGGLIGATVDHSQAISATTRIATEAARNRLIFFAALSVLILSAIAIYQHARNKSRKDQHIKSFSLLFAHMTRTRIAALRLFLTYVDGNAPPSTEMAHAALSTVLELDSINEGLMRIGHARTDARKLPLGQIIAGIVSAAKQELRVEANDDALAIPVPSAQFHMLIDELVRNAINAVSMRPNPQITIRGRLQRRFVLGERLVLSVEDNGTGMTPHLLARAREPFFSTKAGVHVGLGLTNSVELIKSMGGKLDMSSFPHIGTTVHIAYPL